MSGSNRSASTTPIARRAGPNSAHSSSSMRRTPRGGLGVRNEGLLPLNDRDTSTPVQRNRPRTFDSSNTRGTPTINEQGTARFAQTRSRNTPLNPNQRLPYSDETTESASRADREEDNKDEIVMAIDMRGRSTIGCAYYVSRDETLYFMEDSKLADASIIDSCQCFRRKNDGDRLMLS
jgi:hypothetical protein